MKKNSVFIILNQNNEKYEKIAFYHNKYNTIKAVFFIFLTILIKFQAPVTYEASLSTSD